jgi:hypothetical protein
MKKLQFVGIAMAGVFLAFCSTASSAHADEVWYKSGSVGGYMSDVISQNMITFEMFTIGVNPGYSGWVNNSDFTMMGVKDPFVVTWGVEAGGPQTIFTALVSKGDPGNPFLTGNLIFQLGVDNLIFDIKDAMGSGTDTGGAPPAPTPEPASLLLLGTGLLGMGIGLRRRSFPS